MDNRAVSPVIAVVTMVGIAVALSATVFLVSRALTSSDPGHVEPVALVPNEDGHVSVARGADLDWTHVTVKPSAPVRFSLDAQATSSSQAVDTDEMARVSLLPRTMVAGSYVDFCAPGLQMLGVSITLTYDDHAGHNRILEELEFDILEPCL